MALPSDEMQELILSLYQESRTTTPDEFFHFALHALRKPLWFESGVAASAQTERSQFHYHACQLWNQPAEKILDYNREIGGQDTVASAMLRHPGTVVTAAFAKETPKSEALIAYSRRYDIGHTMCIAMAFPGTTLSNGVALWRGQRSKAYSDREQRLAQAILPHLLQALAFNLADTVKNSLVMPDNGVAIVSPDGFIIAIDPRAQQLIREEWQEWHPPRLPPPLLDGAMARDDRRFTGRCILASVLPQKTFLVIQLQRQQCVERLTPAELRVALLAAEGMAYKQVAREVQLSPATVRNHLHNAYRKLAVSNKTELALCLARQR